MNAQKLSDWCERSVVYSFYALIYFLPISTALVEIFSTIIIVAYLVKRGVVFSRTKSILKSFQPEPSPLNLPIGIFFLVNFFSSVFSQYPAVSCKGLIFKLIQEIVLYFALVEFMKKKKQLQIFSGVFLVSGTLIVINGLVEYFKGKGFIHGNLLVGGRVMSSFNHPNDLGAYLIIIVIIALALLMAGRTKAPLAAIKNGSSYFFLPLVQLALLALLVASLYCMGLTFSRGAWVGLLCGLLYLAVARKRQFYIPLAVLIIFFMFFLPKLERERNVSFISDDAQGYGEVLSGEREEPIMYESMKHNKAFTDEDGPDYWERASWLVGTFSATGRKSFWQDALEVIQKYPFLGMGLNTYSKVASEYTHNCYLQMGAETGLIGLASFFWILFRLFYNAAVSMSRIRDPFLWALVGGVSAGLFGFLWHSFVDTTFFSVRLGSLLWILMAVIAVIPKLDREEGL
jgi:putative inorganic carbon (hco3(-)) transporter